MTKKKLNTQAVVNELRGESAFFKKPSLNTPLPEKSSVKKEQGGREDLKERRQASERNVIKATQRSTRVRTASRDRSSDSPRDFSRDKLRNLPTRNEIQEFSFRLRDELKVKVQAEVPHQWQRELDQIARDLNVKKLELYRFILGEFLGKVQRKKPT